VSDADLSERLARVEARLAIGDLVARYGHVIDDRDPTATAALFTAGGAFVYPGGSVTGRDDIQAFFAEQQERVESSFHYPHSHLVEVDGDRATGIVSAHSEQSFDGSCVVAGMRYDDVYALEDGAWRFERRRVGFRYYLPWRDFAESYRESPGFRRAAR
jgi:hypothetical protein